MGGAAIPKEPYCTVIPPRLPIRFLPRGRSAHRLADRRFDPIRGRNPSKAFLMGPEPTRRVDRKDPVKIGGNERSREWPKFSRFPPRTPPRPTRAGGAKNPKMGRLEALKWSLIKFIARSYPK